MNFISFQYAMFLPIVFALYWLIPSKFRWLLLFIASYYFYMCWNVEYVILIMFTTMISYFCAILLSRSRTAAQKKIYLISALIACLGVLFVFKYFNFFAFNIAAVSGALGLSLHPITLKILLPVGISFYTFQTLSYVIDVYRGDIEPEYHFGKYATFISFFPQLVAGPIERSKNLLPQIKNPAPFEYSQATYGLKQLAWGVFKKAAIADILAVYVDEIYNNPTSHSGFSVILASVFFALQIYCDFSGYSDIAIGTAKMFGINLMTNFKSPYFSASVREFWSRWHISLSTWFRDYVYIPLGGNRVGKIRRQVNVLITFLLSGLWHGASWNFFIWGGMHGTAQMIENVFRKKRKVNEPSQLSIHRVLLIGMVFLFTTIAWVFFRASNFSDALYLLGNLKLDDLALPIQYISTGFSDLGMEKSNLIRIAFSILLLSAFDYYNLKNDTISMIGKLPLVVRWCIYIAFAVMTSFCMSKDSGGDFIYFQF